MAQISFSGNLGQDPQLRFTASGKAVLNLSVAEGHRKMDQSGQWVDDGSTWFRVAVFGKEAERAAEVLRKGSKVTVTGTVRNKPYEKDGVTKDSYEVVGSVAVSVWDKGFGAQAPAQTAAGNDPWAQTHSAPPKSSNGHSQNPPF